MQNKIIQFTLAALIVAIIGGFAGYYLFIKNKTQETQAAANARGDGDASFTGSVGSTYQNITEGSGTTTAQLGKRAPRLWHVTKTPIAGFGFGAGGTYLYIAERATGNILRADQSVSSITRLTNTLIPKVREALFSRSGDVILRTSNEADGITTFAGTIATTTVVTSTSTSNILEGTYLPQDIVSVAVVPNQPTSKGIFYITKLPDGGSVGVTSGWKGSGVARVFTSPLTQWRSQRLADGRIVLTQSPSDDIAGYSFVVAKDGSMTELLTDMPGLEVLFHDTNDAYLYSTSESGSVSLFVKTAKGAAVKLPVQTVVDKCVWAPGAGLIAYCAVPTTPPGSNYLVNWYEGVTHSQDVWWKIEAAEGTASRFFVPDTRTDFDVETPSIDESGAYIGFRDAADKSLWLLRISE
jgi:hypothetical protein